MKIKIYKMDEMGEMKGIKYVFYQVLTNFMLHPVFQVADERPRAATGEREARSSIKINREKQATHGSS